MSDTNKTNIFKMSLSNKFNQLLKSRRHVGEKLVLSHKNIYVLPSRFGLIYFFFCILIFILGSNYQNNLILLTAYLMVSFLVINFVLAYLNLVTMKINFQATKSGYQHNGYHISFDVKRKPTCYNLVFETKLGIERLQSSDSKDGKLELLQIQKKRGQHQLERIKISSKYPFGLVTAWSYALFPASVYVYPTPLPFSIHQISNENDEQSTEEDKARSQGDNYQAVRPYIAGDNLSRISWKHFAKLNQLYTKEFNSPASHEYHFDLNKVPGDFEQKLKHLSYLINHAEQDHLSYSLNLPKTTIKVGNGQAHFIKCMEALSDA